MNNVQLFNQQHVQVFKDLALVTKSKKQLEAQEKEYKKQLEEAMDLYGIKSIDNDHLKITRVEPKPSVSIDLVKLEDKEPDLHADLLNDYPKVSTKKPYLTFKVK